MLKLWDGKLIVDTVVPTPIAEDVKVTGFTINLFKVWLYFKVTDSVEFGVTERLIVFDVDMPWDWFVATTDSNLVTFPWMDLLTAVNECLVPPPIENPEVFSCYPDIVPGRSIDDAINLFGDLDCYSIYKKMDQWNWKESLEKAFRKMYNVWYL